MPPTPVPSEHPALDLQSVASIKAQQMAWPYVTVTLAVHAERVVWLAERVVWLAQRSQPSKRSEDLSELDPV